MEVYKLTILINDQDVRSKEDAIEIMQNARYANRTHVQVIDCESAEIGEWHDEHPLNYLDKIKDEMERIFKGETK